VDAGAAARNGVNVWQTDAFGPAAAHVQSNTSALIQPFSLVTPYGHCIDQQGHSAFRAHIAIVLGPFAGDGLIQLSRCEM
jgi:hypothetical protein